MLVSGQLRLCKSSKLEDHVLHMCLYSQTAGGPQTNAVAALSRVQSYNNSGTQHTGLMMLDVVQLHCTASCGLSADDIYPQCTAACNCPHKQGLLLNDV